MDKETNDLIFNMMCDMRKHDIDVFSRARLIRQYIDAKNISIRELSRQIGVAKSTLEDWLRWERIDESDYKEHIESGHTKTDVYEALRDGTLSKRPPELDRMLTNCISRLEVFKIKPPHSNDTIKLIGRLRAVLLVIERQVR